MKGLLFALALWLPAGAFGQDIIISEIMINPDDVSDTNGEWFEVYNASSASIDLAGWEIADNDSDDHTIGGSLVVAPGAYAVLCRNADTSTNGDFSCDYDYTSFTLTNTVDEIILCSSSPCVAGVNEVDRVEYTTSGWPKPVGASIVFIGTAGADNNNSSNWSASDTRESTFANSTADCGVNPEPDCGSPGTKGLIGQLPVELSSFEARLDGDTVTLMWTTASETNNAGFEIQQRTEDAWTALGWRDGHGTTAEPQRYRFAAGALPPGRHRFRLKQIDFDGGYAYSPEAEVAVAVPGAFVLGSVYPNPSRGAVSFSLSVARTQRVEVGVYDVRGRRVARLFGRMWPGGTTRAFRLETGALPSGVYLVRVIGEHFAASRSVLRVR